MITKRPAWGWIEDDGTPQPDVFETADDALAEMRRRHGKSNLSIETLACMGFRLGRVEVTVREISVLSDENFVAKKA